MKLQRSLNASQARFAKRHGAISVRGLHKHGVQIGKYTLRENQWHLYLDDVLFMSGPPNGLFYLPEFEHKSLTALINKE